MRSEGATTSALSSLRSLPYGGLRAQHAMDRPCGSLYATLHMWSTLGTALGSLQLAHYDTCRAQGCPQAKSNRVWGATARSCNTSRMHLVTSLSLHHARHCTVGKLGTSLSFSFPQVMPVSCPGSSCGQAVLDMCVRYSPTARSKSHGRARTRNKRSERWKRWFMAYRRRALGIRAGRSGGAGNGSNPLGEVE